jgi:hypothetical protein
MFLEDFFLLRARREVAVEVQSAFAHGNHVRFLEQTAQTAGAVCIPVAGRMGVNTGGGEQLLAAVIQLLALQRLFATFDAGAGQHQLADPGGVGALEHGLMFVSKTGVGQVDADIDELHGATSDQRPESISELSIYQKSQELQRVKAVF